MKQGLAVLILVMITMPAPGQAASSGWDKAQESYDGKLEITVYRDPDCGCCKDWISHLRKHKFEVTDVPTRDVQGIKLRHGLPAKVASCHTALIDGYVIEGHVPADDIKRLLKNRPKIKGLSVPQMPVGTPGMEMGKQKDPFAVISFDENGNLDAFNQYWSY